MEWPNPLTYSGDLDTQRIIVSGIALLHLLGYSPKRLGIGISDEASIEDEARRNPQS